MSVHRRDIRRDQLDLDSGPRHREVIYRISDKRHIRSGLDARMVCTAAGWIIATADGGASWSLWIPGNCGLQPSPVIAASFFDSGGGWIAGFTPPPGSGSVFRELFPKQRSAMPVESRQVRLI